MGFPGGSDSKASAHNVGDPGSIPGSGRTPGEGKGYPCQYSSLEKSMHRGYSPWGRKESDKTERLHFLYTVKGFSIVSEAEEDVFLFDFSMIQWMLTLWSLVI